MFLKKKSFFDEPIKVKKEVKEEFVASATDSFEVIDTNESADNYEPEFSVHDEDILEKIKKLESLCKESKRKDLMEELLSLRSFLVSSKFTVAVVGEFNRGKSTLVNNIADMDIIPTSIIPTTATLIHVCGGKEDALVLSSRKGVKKYPFEVESWDKIEEEKAKNDKASYRISITRNIPFLTNNDIEFIDTPGVNSQIEGDLTMAERAINECDCAILPMDATAPFSMTETMFLEEHIMVKKIPRIMVVLTKLDLVDESQRKTVVELARDRLSTIGAGIPLFISAADLLPGWEAFSGIEAMKKQLLSWLNESNYLSLKKERATESLKGIASSLCDVYNCQLEILEEKEEDRKVLVEKKKQQFVRDSQIQWETFEIEMLNRCNRNFEWIREMVSERREDLIEKLLLELSHVTAPKSWWERDYPYRVKMEMISLGNSLENNLQNFYTRDINWLNHQLQEKYGVSIPPSNQRIADKAIFRNPMMQGNVTLSDMRKARLISRVGTGALTVAGYAVGGAFGFSPIGMAVGLGGGIVSELFMNKKVEMQKETLSAVIREKLPQVIDNCISSVENNIREYYTETVEGIKSSSSEWINAKIEAIDLAQSQGQGSKMREEILSKLDFLKNFE